MRHMVSLSLFRIQQTSAFLVRKRKNTFKKLIWSCHIFVFYQ